jgi:hypothetical protein
MARQRPHIDVLGTRWLLKYTWDPYQRFVNSQDPHERLRGDWVEHRQRLERVLRGERPLPGAQTSPPLLLVDAGGKVQWAVTKTFVHQEDLAGEPQEKVDRLREQYRFTLMLLGLPETEGLLRRCDRCERFFLGARAHRRAQSFCSDECRFAFHRKQRSKEAQAEYMRQYRKVKATLRRKRLTGASGRRRGK